MLIARIEEAKDSGGWRRAEVLRGDRLLSESADKADTQVRNVRGIFFEWEQGNPYRIAGFLRTLGYEGLGPLPQERRIQFTALADSMPLWPRKGSIARAGDTVLIKFGNYSTVQRQSICEPVHTKEPFCEQ